MIGHGAFTVVSDERQRTNRPSNVAILAFVSSWHRLMRGMRLTGAHFEGSKKEAQTLEAVAARPIAEDITARDGVATRSVEMRLQSLRRKLKVRHSGDAVYKAVAHGYPNA
ncbi:MAG: hypothetical protein ACR2PF_17625 [Rhizobiaceae bacterium]